MTKRRLGQGKGLYKMPKEFKRPTFTPKEAAEYMDSRSPDRTKLSDVSHEGFSLSWEGGPGCFSSPELWAPVASRGDEEEWWSSGEPGDPITDDTFWVWNGPGEMAPITDDTFWVYNGPGEMAPEPSDMACFTADSLSRSSVEQIASFLERSAQFGALQMTVHEVGVLKTTANQLREILTWQSED